MPMAMEEIKEGEQGNNKNTKKSGTDNYHPKKGGGNESHHGLAIHKHLK